MKTRQPTSNRQPACTAWLTLLVAFLAANAASRADIIYVSNHNNDTIEKYDSVTGSDLGTFVNNISGGPRGVALDSAGNLYAVIWGTQTVMKYSPAGVGSVFATGFNGADGLALDSAGNLYVGDTWDNTIIKFTPGGVGSVFASTGLNTPAGMAFDSAGNLFVANSDGNTIQKFTPNGVGSVFARGLYHPYGLAFDNADNLFAANYWGPYYNQPSIQRFTPAGVRTRTKIILPT